MPGRVTAVLFLLLSFSLDAFPQCSWTSRASAQFRTTVLDVATDGAFVWIATSYGVQLLVNGRVADSIALPGATRVIVADGNGYAYAGSGTRVYALRRSGERIQRFGAADTGAPINDLVLVNNARYLFAATSTGIVELDRLDPSAPVRLTTSLPTSSPNVTSLAIAASTLYAADGDASVELFSIASPSLPQHTGTLESVQRASAVHATASGLIYVSDKFGQTTDIFAGVTRLTRLNLGSNSFASSPQADFVAGPDRTLRAIDASNAANVAKLFEVQLPPAGGNDNAIHALARSGDTLYVAAGDIGLVTVDVSSLDRPHPLASYSGGATTSVVASATKAYFSDATNHISEVTIDPAGLSLRTVRSWTDAATPAKVLDLRGDLLLTAAGTTLTRWNLTANPPSAGQTTMPAAVQAGVLTSSGYLALLVNGALFNESGQVTLGYKPAYLARAGDAIALVEVKESGSTILHYFQNGGATETRTITIDGVATGGVALNATHAALFTFHGIHVIDLAAGTSTVIEGSNRAIPRQLAFAGDDLLAVDARTLYVYDDARTLVRQQSLPSDANAIAGAEPYAVIATAEGMLATRYLAEQPVVTALMHNRFYTKLVLSGDRLVLFGDDGIDIYSTLYDMPSFAGSIPAAGAIDVAATSDRIFTLSANGTVTAYSHAGVALAQTTLTPSTDAQPLSIDTAGNAVWVAFSVGCLSGGCQKKTLVVDPSSLVTTATLDGGVVDVVSAATRAYALFALPDEVRVYNISDPLHPSQIAMTSAPSAATSLSAGGGKVYVAGDKIYVYNDTTLSAAGSQLTAVTPAATQLIRIDGGCAVITGRSANPESWTLPAFATGGTLFETPSNVRAVAVESGRLFFLTEHSLEVWSARPVTLPTRRRSAR